MSPFRSLLIAAALCALTGASARADVVNLAFDFSTLVAQPGATVTARGTITNNVNAIVDLNGCSLTLPGGFTTDSCAIFLSATGAPLSLGIGESATVDLFTFSPDIPFSGVGGLQPAGSFTILGTQEVSGYDPDTQNVLVDAPFQVNVVPEPSTFALLGLALPILYRIRRRKGA